MKYALLIITAFVFTGANADCNKTKHHSKVTAKKNANGIVKHKSNVIHDRNNVHDKQDIDTLFNFCGGLDGFCHEPSKTENNLPTYESPGFVD